MYTLSLGIDSLPEGLQSLLSHSNMNAIVDWIVFPQYSYVDVLTANMTVFGDGTSNEVIKRCCKSGTLIQ